MEIETSGTNWPVVVLVLVVIACVLISGAALALSGRLDLHIGASPEQEAKAETIRAISVKATAQALEQITIENERKNRQAESNLKAAQESRAKFQAVWFPVRTLVLISLGALIACAVLAFVLTFGSYTYYRVRTDLERAKIQPIIYKPIGNHLIIVSSQGGPILVDALTGARALLSNPQEVNLVRAGAMVRLAELKQPNKIEVIPAKIPQEVENEEN